MRLGNLKLLSYITLLDCDFRKLTRANISAAIFLLGLTPFTSWAGLLDRSEQSIAPVFESGLYFEYQQQLVYPEVSGIDSLGNEVENVSQSYAIASLAAKMGLSSKWDVAFIIDQPWDGDFQYDTSSLLYGGTVAQAESYAMTAVFHYSLTEHFSLVAGPRAQNFNGRLQLRGLAFGPLNGYDLTAENDWSWGHTLGLAYERKELGMRINLTYHSDIEHKLRSTETLSPVATQTRITTPASVNLGLRSGIAPGTLLFGSVRWVEWSGFEFQPSALPFSVASFDDDLLTYSLGVAYQFNTNWAGTVVLRHEPELRGEGSIFRPANGYQSVTLGGGYKLANGVQLGAAFSYALPGDSDFTTQGGNGVAFSDSESLAFSFRVSYQVD